MTDAEKALLPASPDDYGLPPADLTTEGDESAAELAQAAREQLRGAGFTDSQVDAWAASYVYELGNGKVEDLIGWMTAMQDVD